MERPIPFSTMMNFGACCRQACTPKLRTNVLFRLRYSTTTPPLFSSSGTADTTTPDNPLQAITNAIHALQQAAERLQSIQQSIQTEHQLVSGHRVTMRDMVLHSRDAAPDEFATFTAQAARDAMLPHAEQVEIDLTSLGEFYLTIVVPHMQTAVQICQETPCGGATWEMETLATTGTSALSSDTKKKKNQHHHAYTQDHKNIHVDRGDTPCARLHAANVDFLQTTFDTKTDVILGTRGALILRLARDLQQPLATARQDANLKQQIGRALAEQVVATPWIRTDEEYQHFFQTKDEMKSS